jgi:hypothetical protein
VRLAGRGQRTEDRGQRAEDRGQGAEGRGQRAGGRGQGAEGPSSLSELRRGKQRAEMVICLSVIGFEELKSDFISHLWQKYKIRFLSNSNDD